MLPSLQPGNAAARGKGGAVKWPGSSRTGPLPRGVYRMPYPDKEGRRIVAAVDSRGVCLFGLPLRPGMEEVARCVLDCIDPVAPPALVVHTNPAPNRRGRKGRPHLQAVRGGAR